MSDKTTFDYALSPTTVYITVDKDNTSIAAIDIGVTNNTENHVECDYIAFVIPVGEGAGALTADANSISTSSSRPDEWTLVPVQGAPGQFRAEPVSPNTGLKAGGSISFQLADIVVNGELGAPKVDIIEMTDERRDDTRNLNKSKSDLRIEFFMVTPTSIKPGQNANLRWKTQAAAKCQLSKAGFPPDDVIVTGSMQVSPSDSTSTRSTLSAGDRFRRP